MYNWTGNMAAFLKPLTETPSCVSSREMCADTRNVRGHARDARVMIRKMASLGKKCTFRQTVVNK